MDGNKAVVLSGDWINVAVINANQYNIEQVVQTKFQDVGYCVIWLLKVLSLKLYMTVTEITGWQLVTQPERCVGFDSMFSYDN